MCLSRSRSTPCCRHNQTDPLPGPFPLMRIDKASTTTFMASPKMRHWNDIMRLKSAVVYTFLRDITNNHSPEDAARLLFREHRFVPGSGWLPAFARFPKLPARPQYPTFPKAAWPARLQNQPEKGSRHRRRESNLKPMRGKFVGFDRPSI